MTRCAVFGAAVLAFAAAAASPDFASAADGRFASADLNSDGVINECEFYETQSFARHAFFFRADRDNDRLLDAQEFKDVDFLSEQRRTRSGE